MQTGQPWQQREGGCPNLSSHLINLLGEREWLWAQREEQKLLLSLLLKESHSHTAGWLNAEWGRKWFLPRSHMLVPGQWARAGRHVSLYGTGSTNSSLVRGTFIHSLHVINNSFIYMQAWPPCAISVKVLTMTQIFPMHSLPYSSFQKKMAKTSDSRARWFPVSGPESAAKTQGSGLTWWCRTRAKMLLHLCPDLFSPSKKN